MLHLVQPPFPALPEEHLRAELSLVTSRSGDVVVGWTVEGLLTELPLAIGCLPPCTRQDLDDRVAEVLAALLQAVAMLHDWDPFDGL